MDGTFPRDALGYVAACVGVSIMIPQVAKILRTRCIDDVSLYMVLLNMANCILWGIYGILMGAVPVMVANCAGLTVGITLFVTYTLIGRGILKPGQAGER